MTTYILRRVVLTIPVLLGILALTFFLTRLLPGEPCVAIYGERATPEICAAFAERYGLNLPVTQQFTQYVGRVLQGDLGDSIRFSRPVTSLMAERLPVTVELAFAALCFAIVIGIPAGIISAYKRNTAADYMTMIIANIGVSMPVFWLGLMLAYAFAVGLKDTPFALPPSGRLDAGTTVTPFFVQWGIAPDEASASPILVFIARLYTLNAILTADMALLSNSIRHLILPAVAVGTISMSIIARMTRSSVLETLNQDYVRTARAKGLREFTVVIRHAVRNSLLPIVTIIGLNFGLLISGAVLTETVFGLTGVGRTLFDGITSRDYPMVQGFTVFIAFAFVLINLLVDILYGYLDPRIRLS
ncbi:MAG: ABC transporter permease [Chloroflexi bacterium OLB15]|nr:MAG: ABC transporter permease [Chloroflexi bacterium OLB15]